MKLPLDAHISPAVATGLASWGGVEAQAMRGWQGGTYLDADDEVILSQAHATGWILVTYDLRTIPPLLRVWSEQGVAHSG
ncbi:MAG TPA: hypothetical protein VFU88_09175 [Ktedonobacterales bacterium]|nr:hypothetical protein [Ktedonobacterales bacterium]